MTNPYNFAITTMGIRALVTAIIMKLCLMNAVQISTWNVMALVPLSSVNSPVSLARRTSAENEEVNKEIEQLFKQSSKDDWTELVLTIQWPQSFCMEYNDSHKDSGACKVPAGVTDWTIHGLWPSVPGGMGPSFCNNTWKFDLGKISDIERQMNASWPDFLIDETYYSLWSHEWDKHGTCASTLPALYGEHNYFSKTLSLRKQYDIKGMLAAGSIIPSTSKSYDYQSIFDAVKNKVGTDPILTCAYDQKTHLVYLSQVELCLDKEFNLKDCVAPNSPWKSNLQKSNLRDENCAHDKTIYYPPAMN